MKDIRLKQAIYLSTIFIIAFLCQNCASVPTSSRSSATVEKPNPVLDHLSLRP